MEQGSQSRRAPGRPPLPADKGKRFPVGFRVTKETKDFLQRLSDSSGRSIAQECELRIRESVDAHGSPRAAAFFRAMAERARLVDPDPERWFGDHDTFIAVRDAWIKMLGDVAPPTRSDLVEGTIERVRQMPPEARAQVLQALRFDDADSFPPATVTQTRPQQRRKP